MMVPPDYPASLINNATGSQGAPIGAPVSQAGQPDLASQGDAGAPGGVVTGNPATGGRVHVIDRPARRRLRDRRAACLYDFEHDGHRYVAAVGRFDDGGLAEIFINSAGKCGSAVEAAAKDAAIVVSLALQYSAPAETLRRALTRNGNGSASGAVGALLDLLAQENGGEL